MFSFECPVCLSDCTGLTCQPTECFHEFCHSCMNEWLMKSNKCPLDNSIITEMFVYDTPRGELLQHMLIIDPTLRKKKDDYGISIDGNTNNTTEFMYDIGNYIFDDFEDEIEDGSYVQTNDGDNNNEEYNDGEMNDDNDSEENNDDSDDPDFEVDESGMGYVSDDDLVA